MRARQSENRPPFSEPGIYVDPANREELFWPMTCAGVDIRGILGRGGAGATPLIAAALSFATSRRSGSRSGEGQT
jgi:hypothetical protein